MPSSISTSEPHDVPRSRFLPGPRPRCIAHRGLALDGAENTLRAFHDALEAGATMLETDTRATSDGLALAVHDQDLRRVAGDGRRIRDLTARQARSVRLAGGEPLASLEDVLGSFPGMTVNIDVKTASAIGPAVTAIARTASAGRVCLTSFEGAVAGRAVRMLAEATGVVPARSPSRSVMTAFVLARAVEVPDPVLSALLAPYGALQVPVRYRGIPVVTRANIAAAHRVGCEVHAWTVDDPPTMRNLLAEGVDGIITNRVDLLTQLMEHRGTA